MRDPRTLRPRRAPRAAGLRGGAEQGDATRAVGGHAGGDVEVAVGALDEAEGVGEVGEARDAGDGRTKPLGIGAFGLEKFTRTSKGVWATAAEAGASSASTDATQAHHLHLAVRPTPFERARIFA